MRNKGMIFTIYKILMQALIFIGMGISALAIGFLLTGGMYYYGFV